MPTPNEVHVNQALSNLAAAYKPDDFNMSADAIMPRVTVDKKSDLFLRYTKKDRFTVPNTSRGPRDSAKMVEFGQSWEPYSCRDHALKDFVSLQEEGNADTPLKPQADATEGVTGLMLLDREIRVAGVCTDTSKVTLNDTLSSTELWDDFAHSHPIVAVDAARKECFIRPNTGIFSQPVFDALKRHPDLVDYFRYVQGGVLTEAMVAEALGLKQIVVADAKYNSGDEGLAESYDYIWGTDAVLAYIEPSPSLRSKSFGYTLQWKILAGAAPGGFRVRTWFDQEPGGGGTWVEVDCAHDEKIVCAENAFLFKTAVSG